MCNRERFSSFAAIALIAKVVVCGWVLPTTSGCNRQKAPSGVGAAPAGLVGSWTNVGGDYLLTNEYRADGMFLQHVGGRSSTPDPYRVEGEFIVVSVKQPDGSVIKQRDRFVLEGDTLTFVDADGSNRTFRRASAR